MMLLMLVVRKDHNERVDLADNDNDDYAYVGAADATDDITLSPSLPLCSIKCLLLF